jgi:hypothetical protein
MVPPLPLPFQADIGRQILKDAIRVGKEKQFDDSFTKEKDALAKEGGVAQQEAVLGVERAKEAVAKAEGEFASRTPEEKVGNPPCVVAVHTRVSCVVCGVGCGV